MKLIDINNFVFRLNSITYWRGNSTSHPLGWRYISTNADHKNIYRWVGSRLKFEPNAARFVRQLRNIIIELNCLLPHMQVLMITTLGIFFQLCIISIPGLLFLLFSFCFFFLPLRCRARIKWETYLLNFLIFNYCVTPFLSDNPIKLKCNVFISIMWCSVSSWSSKSMFFCNYAISIISLNWNTFT